jgi:hypothetical protein
VGHIGVLGLGLLLLTLSETRQLVSCYDVLRSNDSEWFAVSKAVVCMRQCDGVGG